MTEQEKIDQVLVMGRKFVSNYQIKLKKDSTVQKIIGWILGKLGNTGYMDSFTTTIGQTSYLPTPDNEAPEDGTWQTIMHETQHAKDAQSISNCAFFAAYLFPQLLGILGAFYTIVVGVALLFGAPFTLLWGCTFLLFLAPLPAFGRAYIEVRGYTVTLAAAYWSGALCDERTCNDWIDWITEQFTGPNYYYMWPFKGWVKGYFEQKLQELKSGTFVLDEYLAACKILTKKLAS